MKKTKIICTIGPSSDSEKKVKELIKNGMDVARLNLSHNNHTYHQGVIKKIRKIAEKLDKPIPIIADLQGPKLRLGSFPEKILVKPQIFIILSSSYEKIDNKSIKIPIIYSNLYKYIQVKDKIILGDNQIELEVQDIKKNKEIICLSLNEGFIFSNMGFNISSDISFKIPILTKKDIRDIKFSVENDIDFIALSFVVSEKNLITLKNLINKYQNKNNFNSIKIIAKIEREAAVKNIDKIINQSDVIMIARGDLGVELPIEKVPLIQKTIIQKCLNCSKPVIVATQMLSSMQNKPSPTRAEASDIANAVIDQADALMLSEETAVGIYPIKAVRIMNRIIVQTEKFEDEQFFKKLTLNKEEDQLISADDSLIFSLNLISQKIKAKLILIISLTGYTGRIISHFRLNIPLFVFTCKKKIARQLNLNWGLFPLTISNKNLCSLSEKIQQNTINYFLKKRILKKKDIILIAGRKDRQYLSSIDWIEIKHI
jgi:pyruvate kinase